MLRDMPGEQQRYHHPYSRIHTPPPITDSVQEDIDRFRVGPEQTIELIDKEDIEKTPRPL
ncbi:uncharacterized protein FIBRA_06841 [Fibroporia radiculosa]|uniref:Uncharacterized protein n=1 Tax=Fibroporia radiculosa TaxID=599839 RepID=J4HZR0_9APHY|nr:uncharacterized protein FIBRA_06841 [Fibroporia radiculosa]CCM04657.1 predicted protein [Fibroporia radiculosa]